MEYDYNYCERSEFGGDYMDCEIDDFKQYCAEVCEEVTDEIESYLVDGELVTEVELLGMSSPRYYNFTTDKLQLSVVCDIMRLANKLWYDEEMHRCFDRYLHRKYSTCDGFISFVDNNIGDFMDSWKYLDVMVDYWLLTKIYDTPDVCAALDKCEWTAYRERMYEIANDVLYRHMRPISEADYIRSELRSDKMQEWAKARFDTHRAWFGNAERVIEECKDEFYQVAGCKRYEEYENVRQYIDYIN